MTTVMKAGVPRPVAALLALILAFPAQAGAPDYDAFSDRDGKITTKQHGLGLIALVRDTVELEAVFEDARRGDVRANRVFDELETSYFPDIGRELAELVSRPPCLVPVFRELSGWCVPDWSFLDFLSKDKLGGLRLRVALLNGYMERGRQRNLENQLIVSAMTSILGASVVANALREAGVAATISRVPAASSTAKVGRLRQSEIPRDATGGIDDAARFVVSPKGTTVERAVADRWAKGTFGNVVDSIEYHFAKHGAGRTLQQYTDDAVRFFQQNKGQAQWGKWNPNWEPSYRLNIGKQGGYFTADGRVLTYWD